MRYPTRPLVVAGGVVHTEASIWLESLLFHSEGQMVACPPLLAGGGDSTADEQFENHALLLLHMAVMVMLVAVKQSFT